MTQPSPLKTNQYFNLNNRKVYFDILLYLKKLFKVPDSLGLIIGLLLT